MIHAHDYARGDFRDHDAHEIEEWHNEIHEGRGHEPDDHEYDREHSDLPDQHIFGPRDIDPDDDLQSPNEHGVDSETAYRAELRDFGDQYDYDPVFGHRRKGRRRNLMTVTEPERSFLRRMHEAASSLPQLQEVVDPNNVPDPQADQLPADVMFPIDPAFAQQWVTGPQGAQPRGATASIQAEAVKFSRKHHEYLAHYTSLLPDELRAPVAKAVGRAIPHVDNGMGPYQEDKFVRAATDPESYTWRSMHRHPGFTRGHHDVVSGAIANLPYSGLSDAQTKHVAEHFAREMNGGSKSFSVKRFYDRAQGRHDLGLDSGAPLMYSQTDHPPADRYSYPRYRSQPQPAPAVPRERFDLERHRQQYSSPGRTSDEYGERVPEVYVPPERHEFNTTPTESSGYHQQMPDKSDEVEYDPIFGWRSKAALASLRRRAVSEDDAAGGRRPVYSPPPRGKDELMGHLMSQHGAKFTGTKDPGDRFLLGLHDRMHAGEYEGYPGGDLHTAHQHDNPFGHDPVFGSRSAAPENPHLAQARVASLMLRPRETWSAAEIQVVADFMSKPHQSTDDLAVPFNSQETTPPSQDNVPSSYSEGFREGQQDRAAGEKPTFSDNSSHVSPYVFGYAAGYGGGSPASGAPSPDVPRSMGGDSGQPLNDQAASANWQVAQASRRQGAGRGDGIEGRCDECTGRAGSHADWCSSKGGSGDSGDDDDDSWVYASLRRRADVSESKREHAEQAGHTLPGTDKFPIDNATDLANAKHDIGRTSEPHDKVVRYIDERAKALGKPGVGGRAASLRVSAAFVPGPARSDPDFRKGYGFASRWKAGQRLVSTGSAAFEAGLYAAMCDRPRAQGAWVGAHRMIASRNKGMLARLEKSASFSQRVAAADSRFAIARNGCYPIIVNAATSTDLITDGPGTSPDPMGATPLNGPGQPPPMGGGEDPARSGGPSPYQGAEPLGHGPVAPDDVIGQPQEPPQESGPFTQTFSGRHPGNVDLAPVAPNAAGTAGYENTEAYQGDPRVRQQAFRQRVQAALTAQAMAPGSRSLDNGVHRALRDAWNGWTEGRRRQPHATAEEIAGHPAVSNLVSGAHEVHSALERLRSAGRARHGVEPGFWEVQPDQGIAAGHV
jgi:hypothetical protein